MPGNAGVAQGATTGGQASAVPPTTPPQKNGLWQSFSRLSIGVRAAIVVVLFGVSINVFHGLSSIIVGRDRFAGSSTAASAASSSTQQLSGSSSQESAVHAYVAVDEHAALSSQEQMEEDAMQEEEYSEPDSAVNDEHESKQESSNVTESEQGTSQSTSQNDQQQVTVPKITNMKESAAVKQLSDIGLNVRIEYKDTPTDSLVGTVASCDAIGKQYSRGDEVVISVWRQALVNVPDVTGLTENAARSRLEALGIVVRVNTEKTDDERLDGKVINCTGIGERINKGETITITVGAYSYVRVPDILSLSEQKAKEKLSSVGLSAHVQYEEVYEKSNDGIVIECNEAGVLLDRGSAVTIRVGTYAFVTVPNVRGKQESEAVRTLRDLGLSVSTEYEDVYEKSKGGVVQECGEIGNELEKGSPVLIIVGRYIEYVTVPNVLILIRNRKACNDMGGYGIIKA